MSGAGDFRCHPGLYAWDPWLGWRKGQVRVDLAVAQGERGSRVRGTMDPGDKPRDDSLGEIGTTWELAR